MDEMVAEGQIAPHRDRLKDFTAMCHEWLEMQKMNSDTNKAPVCHKWLELCK